MTERPSIRSKITICGALAAVLDTDQIQAGQVIFLARA
jgi:hypothetical protein